MSIMSRINNPQNPLSIDPQIDEDRVRRALGLKSSAPHQQRPEQARQRHRFVVDGAVPVVMLNRTDTETSGLKEKRAAAETALETERAAHAATRRALNEMQAAHQALQTRFHHAELSHNEALSAEREGRRAAEEALAALRAQPAPTTEVPRRTYRQATESTLERPARKPRAGAAPKEHKPVRWWTPSFRAKKG